MAVGDFRPTDQQHEVHQVLKDRLRTALGELSGLLQTDLPAFNEALAEHDLPKVVAGTE